MTVLLMMRALNLRATRALRMQQAARKQAASATLRETFDNMSEVIEPLERGGGVEDQGGG